MEEKKVIIQLRDVCKSFQNHMVLKDLSLDIYKEETFVIIGPSGIGKSTVLKHLAGLLLPDFGSICIENLEITQLGELELNELRKKMGFVFQSAALFDSLNVFENVAFRLLRDYQIPVSEAEKIVLEKLELVGLKPEIINKKPAELSGGMKKRVGLARAIAVNPEFVFYDEPTSGLDPISARAINDLILNLQKKLKVTSIVVTHDLSSAYRVANRIGMLYDGKIIGLGTPEALQQNTDPRIQKFIYSTL